jgi:hypothetical protein
MTRDVGVLSPREVERDRVRIAQLLFERRLRREVLALKLGLDAPRTVRTVEIPRDDRVEDARLVMSLLLD